MSLGGTITTFTGTSINGSTNTLTNIANGSLTNSSITINGSTVSLGGTITVTATSSGTLTIGTGLSGTSYNGSSNVTIAIDSTVATLTGTQTLTNKTIDGASNTLTNIANGSLTNSSITIGSTSVSLGGTITTLAGTSISGSTNTLSNIGNGSLTNSQITLGSTAVSLGATASALAGLASVAVTADPTTALQLATKQYVDGLVSSGLIYHQPVQAGTTTTLAATTGGTVTYNQPGGAGVGVGATLTLSVPLTVLDGYTLLNTNRILVKDEANQAHNGIYTWATGGTVLTRATDADTYGVGTNTISLNDYFFTQYGTVNAGTSYVVTTVGVITFGTTAITFAEFSSSKVYTGTAPINVSGTVISLNTVPATSGGTGTATVATGDLLYGSAANTWSKLAAGTNGYILTLAAGVPSWAPAPASGVTSFSAGTTGFTPNTATSGAVTLAGTLSTANGGTGTIYGVTGGTF